MRPSLSPNSGRWRQGRYGPDWEKRGRSVLGAAALLLAALWPSGAPPAAQGAAVHQISLRRRLPHRHIGTVKAAIAGGAAIAVVAAAVALASGHSHRSSGPLDRSFSIAGGLAAVAATSASNAWAVGSAGSFLSPKPLIAHWNGTSWKQVPSSGLPGGELRAVAATSASNAWAVGGTSSGQSLILHWNGTSWERVPSAGAGNLTAVSASSATNAWSVGSESAFGSGFGKTLILHWNGASWKRVSSPSLAGNASLTSVAVTSGHDAWAVGGVSTGTSPATSLILHWNGTAWQRVPSPSPSAGQFGNGLSSVAATSATNAWAVGCTDGCPVGGTPLIERWNGTSWQQVAAPTAPYALYNLAGVAASSGTSAWVVGGGGPATLESRRLRTGTAAVGRWSWKNRCHTERGHRDLRHRRLGRRRHRHGRTVILYWNGRMWSGPVGQVPPAAAPTSSAVSSPVPSAVSSAVPSSAVPSRRQAAQALAALLAQSGTDRATVTQAVGAVAGCSPGLSQDETIFSNAASSHQALLAKLAALPDRSALPASMLTDLTMAWQASGQADQDFAMWAQDEISHGCSTNYQSDASYQAATVPDDQATKDKKAFAALWTAIANEYGLPLYRYNQM